MHEVAAYTIVIPKAQDGDCMVYGGEAPRGVFVVVKRE